MRVLLLCWRDTGHPEGGGSETYLEHVAEHLVQSGHEVVYRTAAYPGEKKTSERSGVTFSRAGGNYSVYVRGWLAMLAARFGIGSIARGLGGKPDVVVDTQNGVPFFARIFSGAPTVVLTHHCHREQWPVAGPVTGKIGWFIESRLSPWLHRGCRYITVSEPSAEDLRDLGVAADAIRVIRNGVDPAPAPAESPVAPDTDIDPCSPEHGPRLVTLSRLVPHKQIEHAIDAVAELVTDYPNAQLDIIGSGWWTDELVRYAEERNVGKHVVFHGHVSEEEKHAILAGACLHLMPSRKEGWGLAVIEAAQHRVPTIGYSSSAGLRDSVVDGETGVLAQDRRHLEELTRMLIDDATTRRALGDAAELRARGFSWDATGAAVQEELESVVANR